MQQIKQKRNENQRARKWLITWNNYPTNYLHIIEQLKFKCSYMIYCLEEAPTTGTRHIHIYCEFNQPIRFSTLKVICQDFHIDKCDQKQENIINYVKKHGNFVEFGTKRQQGQRLDLYMLAQCENYQEVIREHPTKAIQYGRSLKQFFQDRQRYENSNNYQKYPKTVFWIYGDTGSGKSKLFYDFIEKQKLTFWITKDNAKWFDGYFGQEAVLFDDFRANQCSFAWLLRLLDRYPLEVPIKGGFVNWNPKFIFITCPRNYDQEFVQVDKELGRMLDKQYEDLKQLERRINYIHKAFYFNNVFSRQIMKNTLDININAVLDDIFESQNRISMSYHEESEPIIMPNENDRFFDTENINNIFGE